MNSTRKCLSLLSADERVLSPLPVQDHLWKDRLWFRSLICDHVVLNICKSTVSIQVSKIFILLNFIYEFALDRIVARRQNICHKIQMPYYIIFLWNNSLNKLMNLNSILIASMLQNAAYFLSLWSSIKSER